MARARRKPLLDLAELLGSWGLYLRAERRSAETLKSCGDGVRAYLAWCERAGLSGPWVATILGTAGPLRQDTAA